MIFLPRACHTLHDDLSVVITRQMNPNIERTVPNGENVVRRYPVHIRFDNALGRPDANNQAVIPDLVMPATISLHGGKLRVTWQETTPDATLAAIT